LVFAREAGVSTVVPNWLAQRARSNPDHPAVLCEGRVISFADLARRAATLGGRLAGLGVRRGDRVALLMRNRLEFAEILHGVTRVGGTVVALSTRLTPPELCRQLTDCRPRLLLYDGAARDSVTAIRSASSVLTVSVDANGVAGDRTIADVTPEIGKADANIDLDAVHSIIYTSGSTGCSKGVLLTYGNHFWSAAGSAFNLGVRDDDRWLACLPFCHVGGLAVLLRSVLYGITAVIHDGFDPQRVNRAIDAERVTIVSLVANMLQRLLAARGEQPYPPWLRCVLLGGGPAPPALLEACAVRGVPVIQTYGLTEAASQVATLAPRDALRKLGSVGKALLPTQIVLGGPDGPLPTGAVGEIWVRGLTVSPGYVGNAGPRGCEDGWLRTGDLGRFDAEGFLYVVGRCNDLIISGGENIYPSEIEMVLHAHASVAEACVFGMPDPQWGECVAACVRLRPGATLTVRELEEFARQHLAGFKIPRQIRFVDDFPRTAAGKIERQRVRPRSRSPR
jgi:O-succinylbenzoic acid--CoA ligase